MEQSTLEACCRVLNLKVHSVTKATVTLLLPVLNLFTVLSCLSSLAAL